MKKKNIILTILAIVMVLGLTLQGAMAYFTTYVSAAGGMPIHLGHRTTIEEKVENLKKIVNISIKDGPDNVYVRAKAFYPTNLPGMEVVYDNGPEEYEGTVYDGTWYDGQDGWWYYDTPLSKKTLSTARPFIVDIQYKIPEGVKIEKGDNFNVIVVYEATAAVDEKGNPDFSKPLQVEEAE